MYIPGFEWPKHKNPDLSQSKVLNTKFKTNRSNKIILNSLNTFIKNYKRQIQETENKLENKELSKEEADKIIEKQINSIEAVEKMMMKYK